MEGGSGNTVLLSGVVGSTAYGMAGPDSDVDRLGVYAAPTARFHGLNLPVDKKATVSSTGPDFTLHEARKFCLLALNGNPTLTELLFLETYEELTPEGEYLLSIAPAFLSARAIRDAYLGYATAQFKRLVDTGQFASKQRARASKHARHMLRLINQGFELYATGRLTIRLENPAEYIEFGERVHDDHSLAQRVMDSAQQQFDSVTSVLPDAPDTDTVERWLLHTRKQYL